MTAVLDRPRNCPTPAADRKLGVRHDSAPSAARVALSNWFSTDAQEG